MPSPPAPPPATKLMHAAMLMHVTLGEAAAILEVSIQTVRVYIRAKRLLAYRRKRSGRKATITIPGWSIMAFQSDECERTVKGILKAAPPRGETSQTRDITNP